MKTIAKYIHGILLILILMTGAFVRTYRITSVPPGLGVDEVAIGNDAYSVLKTGKDTHGVSFPIFFISLGDYKSPLYAYLTVLLMAVLGKSEMALRLTSAIAGTLAIGILYLIVARLIDKKTALIGAAILMFSPWNLQLSRAVFDTNLGLTFFLAGLYLSIQFYQTKKVAYLPAAVFFYSLSTYAYHSYRLIAPLALITSSWYFYKTIKDYRKQILGGIIFFGLLSLPLVLATFSGGMIRFSQTSVFTGLIKLPWQEKLFTYPIVLLRDYLSFFSAAFLFVFGDRVGAYEMPGFGLIPVWQLPFLIAGLLLLIDQKATLAKKTVLLLFILAPVPGAFTEPVPHAGRGSLLLIPCIICVALGLKYFWQKVKNPVAHLLILGFILWETVNYFHFYYIHYAINAGPDWGGKYKETILKAEDYYKTRKLRTVFSSSFQYWQLYRDFYTGEDLRQAITENGQLKNQSYLYITKDLAGTSKKPAGKLLENIYYDNPNRNIFAQIWEIGPKN